MAGPHFPIPAPLRSAPLPPGVRLSAKAEARLRKPRMRGTFESIDAARRQLALLTVADGLGQARLAWLVELPGTIIADARFLAFGSLASHAVADAFTELVRGRTVSDACRLRAEQVDAVLRDDPMTPACGDGVEPYAFLRDLQERAEAELPRLALLPRPAEALVYQRKAKAEWSSEDTAWFTASYLTRIATVDALAGRVLEQRLGHAVAHVVVALHDDFRVQLRFPGLPPEQIPTAEQFIQDALSGEVHSQLRVENPDQEPQP